MTSQGFDIIGRKYRGSIKYRFRKYFYYGKNYYCLSCGRSLRKFAPFGKPKRNNAECPFCYTLERHRYLLLLLKKKTNFYSTNLRVLDFGPEYYLQVIFKSMQNLVYTSADINPKHAMLKMNIMDIKFDENTFDLIFCIAILEHVLDDRKALKELFRVLKPGGYVIIEVPINSKLKETKEHVRDLLQKDGTMAHIHDSHVREYGRDFKIRLKEIGYQVDNQSVDLEITKENRIRYGLNESENLFFCQKPINNLETITNRGKFKVFKT